MSEQWEASGLLEPVSADEPCGKNIEDADPMGWAAFDAYELFGQSTLEPQKNEDGTEIKRRHRPPEWRDIKNQSLDALKTTRDLRLLGYLASALIRTDGLSAFFKTLGVASHWIEQYWAQVYPQLDEDGDPLFRKNALNGLADPVAVVDGVRRAPLVSSRQHGIFSLRDLDLAAGQVSGTMDGAPQQSQIDAAFEAMPIEELQALADSTTQALASLASVDAAMRRETGVNGAPNFDPLTAQLKKMEAALTAQLEKHPGAAVAAVASEDGVAAGESGAAAVIGVGSIRSRQDAIRALDAAAEFFRRNEPSSPVPLFVERAKRLVAKDFLEVLADIVPDALPQARQAGGLKDE